MKKLETQAKSTKPKYPTVVKAAVLAGAAAATLGACQQPVPLGGQTPHHPAGDEAGRRGDGALTPAEIDDRLTPIRLGGKPLPPKRH